MAFTTSNGRTQSSLAEINVTPFVDVVLVLLVIFMLTASTVESGIEIDVPQTKTVAVLEGDRIIVSIDRKQRLFVGKEAVKVVDLGPKLRSMMGPKQLDVYLRCDKSVPFETYARVIDSMRVSGVEKINFVTKPMDRSEQ